jgi:hypothetical protein
VDFYIETATKCTCAHAILKLSPVVIPLAPTSQVGGKVRTQSKMVLPMITGNW